MPRIRSIKPEFFSSVTLSRVSLEAERTFAGLWNYSDDAGRMRYDPRLLKSWLWALRDSVTVERIPELVAELVKVGVVRLYEKNGEKYLQVTNFSEHQSVDRAKPSQLPAPDGLVERSTKARRSVDEGSTNARRGRKEGRKEGRMEGRSTLPPTLPPPTPPPAAESKNGSHGSKYVDTPQVKRLAAKMDRLGSSALIGYLRAARDPERLFLELDSFVNGSHGPGGRMVPPEQLGKALHEMAVAGAACTSKVLAGFVRRVLDGDPPPRERSPARSTHGPEAEWDRVKREEAAGRVG